MTKTEKRLLINCLKDTLRRLAKLIVILVSFALMFFVFHAVMAIN